MASAEYEAYWRAVRRIPKGRVMTYGDVAIAAGRPGNARRVGYALHALKDPRVPWWRVVNAGGGISLGGPDAERQRAHLEAEGIELVLEGRVPLDRYRFVPRPSRLGKPAKKRGGPKAPS